MAEPADLAPKHRIMLTAENAEMEFEASAMIMGQKAAKAVVKAQESVRVLLFLTLLSRTHTTTPSIHHVSFSCTLRQS